MFRVTAGFAADPEREIAVKQKQKLAKLTVVLMALLMLFSTVLIAGCKEEGTGKEKPNVTGTQKSPEQIAAEKKAKEEAEKKAKEEAGKKAKEAAEQKKKEAEEKAKQEKECIAA